MSRVIVFGATGTVGAYLCLYLCEVGFDVIACGKRSTDNGFFADFGIKYYSIDITDKDSFKVLPTKNIDGVVNLSGILPARMKGYTPQEYIDVNLTGSLNIYDYCASANVKVVVATKSISDVCDLCGSKTPIPSDAEVRFPINNDHSVYCITKNAAADLLTHFAKRHGFKYYLLRFPNIYLYHPNPYYFVNGIEQWQGYRLMIHKAIRGDSISVWGHPGRVRDIVYVKDCIQIIALALSGEACSGVYNVGTGIGTSMLDQVKGILQVFGSNYNHDSIRIDTSKPDSEEYIFDISKTIENFGYKVKYGYIDYLEDFKKEMLAQRFLKLWGEDLTGDLELVRK